jgi:Na+/proline symporter
METSIIILCVFIYFLILLSISYFTSLKANSNSYFDGNKESPWYVVAFGMLGDSLSGVTFISVPGAVLLAHFGYFQLVLGYFFGYLIILSVLLPLYYKLELTSIYSYLNSRFGQQAQYVGAFYFLLSRLLGSAARLFLAATVFQIFIFDALNIPFWVTVLTIIFLIWIYTVKGGIKTLVWTDMFQSLMLIFGVVFSIISIVNQLDISWYDVPKIVYQSPLSQLFEWDWMHKNNFFKQFFGGVFIAVAMTGLDQNMMQKNLSVKTLKDSQKNIFWFSVVMVITNLIFLSLGALLFYYSDLLQIELPLKNDGTVFTDRVFPTLALKYLGVGASISFIVGLAAATFSSADSVLTTLTTSYYVDFLKLNPSEDNKKLRRLLHLLFALILLFLILIINSLQQTTIIDFVLKIAGYTYGPLLGLFFFGIWIKRNIKDFWIPFIGIAAPILTWIIDNEIANIFQYFVPNSNFQLGNLVLLLNGTITFLLLYLFSNSNKK